MPEPKHIEPGRPFVAVEVAVLRTIADQTHVLLTTETSGPCVGMEALPGGLIAHQEPLTAAANRIIAGPTGRTVEARHLFSLDTYERSYRHIAEWTIAFAYMAEGDAIPGIGETEPVAGTRWALVDDLLEDMKRGNLLAYHHSAIIRDAAEVLRDSVLWPPSKTSVIGTNLRERA